jgi:hypothetical protein
MKANPNKNLKRIKAWKANLVSTTVNQHAATINQHDASKT